MKYKTIKCLVFDEEEKALLVDDETVAELGLRFITADTRRSMCGIYKDVDGNIYANKMKSYKVKKGLSKG